MNNGGIRRGLPAGPITYGNLFELQPFQNTLVRLELRGSDLLAALEHAIDDRGVPDAHMSGLTATFDPAAPHGQRLIGAVLEDGSPVRPDGIYTVTANDFIAGAVGLGATVDYLSGIGVPVVAPPEPRWLIGKR